MRIYGKIVIRQAEKDDIPVIENILYDTVSWLNEMGQPLWSFEEVTFKKLSGKPMNGVDYYSETTKSLTFT